jgi:hypothetical protein
MSDPEYNRSAVKKADDYISAIEWFDYREREALKAWGPGNWRNWDPGMLDAAGHERPEIIRAALLRLLSTGFECLGKGGLFIGCDETDMRLSAFMLSATPLLLTKRAVNTARKNFTNRKQWERDRGTQLGEGDEFVPDNVSNTERDALWERAASVLTGTELSLCSLLLQGHSLRDIEAGTAKAGGKVDRRELARMIRGIGEKLRAAGVDPESLWRDQLPHSERFNPGGVMREIPKDPDDNYNNAKAIKGSPDPDETQRERNHVLDRMERRAARPATEAELREGRDAIAAVDARYDALKCDYRGTWGERMQRQEQERHQNAEWRASAEQDETSESDE